MMHHIDHFVLDYSKWRSGYTILRSENSVGKGNTRLLNEQGYMCCVGQFGKQCGVPNEALFGHGYPSDIEATGYLDYLWQHDSLIYNRMANINDTCHLTPAQRLIGICEVLLETGVTMEVINAPEDVLKELYA